MPRLPIAIVLVLACALTWGAPASRAAYMLPGAPVRPKDFSLVKKDGYFHLFYILDSSALYPDQTESSFGHAVSPDLYHWTQLPPVLQVTPLDWDNLHVWAPSIVQKDSLWWMLYTGVTLDSVYNRTQRIGLAVSSDLNTWTRVETPVWDATRTPWAWGDSTSTLPAFRDPFVMPDPQAPGGWLMYYMASYAPDSGSTVVGVARSSGDLSSWTDAGPLLITWRGLTFNASNESPSLIEHDGLWYLFVTTTSSQPLTVYTSADPTGPSWAWTSRGRLRSMLGTDTSTWYASEGLQDGTHELFGYVNGDRVELREMLFGNSWEFSLVQPPYFHVMTVNWTANTVGEGDTTGLFLQVANPGTGAPGLQTFVISPQGAEVPVAPESLGLALPTTVLTDFLTVPWIATRWPRVPATDTVTVTRLRVRTADLTAVSSLITVRARPLPPGTVIPPLPEEPPTYEPPEPGPLPPIKHVFFFRALHDTPLGPTAALAVGLDQPVPVRVDIYDVLGRHVRNLAERDMPIGVTVLPWDGRDQSGVALGRGVYFARLVAGPRVLTVRLVLLGH